jgi:hypothetical protein
VLREICVKLCCLQNTLFLNYCHIKYLLIVRVENSNPEQRSRRDWGAGNGRKSLFGDDATLVYWSTYFVALAVTAWGALSAGSYDRTTLAFRRNIPLPSSASKSKAKQEAAQAALTIFSKVFEQLKASHRAVPWNLSHLSDAPPPHTCVLTGHHITASRNNEYQNTRSTQFMMYLSTMKINLCIFKTCLVICTQIYLPHNILPKYNFNSDLLSL